MKTSKKKKTKKKQHMKRNWRSNFAASELISFANLPSDGSLHFPLFFSNIYFLCSVLFVRMERKRGLISLFVMSVCWNLKNTSKLRNQLKNTFKIIFNFSLFHFFL